MNISIVPMVIGIVIVIFSLFRFYQLASHKIMINKSKAWPITTGIVTDARTQFSSGNKGGKRYRAEFEYNYSIIGSRYNAKIKKASFFGGEEAAISYVNERPIGSTFSIRYNPEKYQEHVVDFDDISANEIATPIFALIYGTFFIFLSFFSNGTNK